MELIKTYVPTSLLKNLKAKYLEEDIWLGYRDYEYACAIHPATTIKLSVIPFEATGKNKKHLQEIELKYIVPVLRTMSQEINDYLRMEGET